MSPAAFVEEYGLRGASGVSSRNLPVGPRLPYTSSVPICTKRGTFLLREDSSKRHVPSTLVRTKADASSILRSTWVSAAKLITASVPATMSTTAGEQISISTKEKCG